MEFRKEREEAAGENNPEDFLSSDFLFSLPNKSTVSLKQDSRLSKAKQGDNSAQGLSPSLHHLGSMSVFGRLSPRSLFLVGLQFGGPEAGP